MFSGGDAIRIAEEIHAPANQDYANPAEPLGDSKQDNRYHNENGDKGTAFRPDLNGWYRGHVCSRESSFYLGVIIDIG
jgi:hypothetical protein